VVDARHTLLSHRDRQRVTLRQHLTGIPRVGANSAALVREFWDGGVEKIAATHRWRGPI